MNSLDALLQSMPASARRVLSALEIAQIRYSLFPAATDDETTQSPIVVGLSGGADSVCLLHALWLLAPYWNLTLHAAHVDHGLRPESGEDADFAREYAEELGAKFHFRRLNAQGLTGDARGVEAAARARRYAFLAEVARDVTASQTSSHECAVHPQPTAAVAHHGDDQAETVLMNFVRGSGLRGLSGMPWVRTLADADGNPITENAQAGAVRLVRPLLALRRSHMLEYVQALDLVYREDQTNLNTAFLRNRVRHEILPALAELNPQIVDTLSRTAELLRPETERAESLDSAALELVTVDASAPLRYVLDLTEFTRLSAAAQRGTIRLLCEQMDVEAREIGFNAIEEMLLRLRTNDYGGGPYSLVGGLSWSVLSDHADHRALFSVHRQDALPWQPTHPHLSDMHSSIALPYALACPGTHTIGYGWALRCQSLTVDKLPSDWQMHEDPWCAFLDSDHVDSPVLTIPAAGLRFAPLGMSGQHRNLGDFFTDRKTPVTLRYQWPIVMDQRDSAVLWVCGYTIGHSARITDATRRILRLEWIQANSSETEATAI